MQTYHSWPDLQLNELFVVSMVTKSFYFKPNIQVGNLTDALEYIEKQ
jgi:hypothetical protein